MSDMSEDSCYYRACQNKASSYYVHKIERNGGNYAYKLIALCGEHEERSNAKNNKSMYSLGRELDLSVFAVFEEIDEDKIEICSRRGGKLVSPEVYMKKSLRQHSNFELHDTRKEEMPELANINPENAINFSLFDRVNFFVKSIIKSFKKKKEFDVEM